MSKVLAYRTYSYIMFFPFSKKRESQNKKIKKRFVTNLLNEISTLLNECIKQNIDTFN